MDRQSKDPFELLDNIESILGISTCPVNWPIGSGKEFKGVYDRGTKEVNMFTAEMNGQKEVNTWNVPIDDPTIDDQIGDYFREKLEEDMELLEGAGSEFDLDEVRAGNLTPVFFGSALTNFGVETFLQHFLKMTESPASRASNLSEVFQANSMRAWKHGMFSPTRRLSFHSLHRLWPVKDRLLIRHMPAIS